MSDLPRGAANRLASVDNHLSLTVLLCVISQLCVLWLTQFQKSGRDQQCHGLHAFCPRPQTLLFKSKGTWLYVQSS